MSCACENARMSKELERVHRLAKALAKIEDDIVAIYINDDGSYGFIQVSEDIEKPILEYITPY